MDAEPLRLEGTGRPSGKRIELLKNRNGVERRPLQLWPTRLAVVQSLERVMAYLDLRPYQLGKLIGIRNPSMIYQWLAGQQRPSAHYCLMMTLAVLERAEQEAEGNVQGREHHEQTAAGANP